MMLPSGAASAAGPAPIYIGAMAAGKKPNDLTTQVLIEIRDEIRRTNGRLDQTNERLDQTNERLELLA